LTGSTLAQEIATKILTVYTDPKPLECTRAQMMLKQPDGSETQHGGRNKQSIVNVIDEVLTRHGIGLE
jgi:hypothetical protein